MTQIKLSKWMESPLKCYLFLILAVLLFIIAGCSDSIAYDDDEVAAIVRGEEITVGELRFLYTDEELLNVIDGAIKAKLVVQEAKKMNIDVSSEVNEMVEALGEYPPDHFAAETVSELREFVEPQAKKLGLSPEEYYTEYNEITSEMGVYINAYIQEVIGDSSEDIEKFDEQANEHLDDLVRENQNEIEVLIEN